MKKTFKEVNSASHLVIHPDLDNLPSKIRKEINWLSYTIWDLIQKGLHQDAMELAIEKNNEYRDRGITEKIFLDQM